MLLTKRFDTMKLPNADHALVPEAKVLEYLLAEAHPRGRYKAAFFLSLGFERREWRKFDTVLTRHPAEHDVCRVEDSRFGKRYVIDGPIDAPDGSRPGIRTVWFVETGGDIPVLVTAYPVKERR